MTANTDQQRIAELPELPEPMEIIWPELHSHALGCGVEDRGIHDRYEAAEYGWQDGVDKAAECVPEDIYDADTLRSYALAAQAPLIERIAELEKALGAAQSALRSYQYGNSSTEFAKGIADICGTVLAQSNGQSEQQGGV